VRQRIDGADRRGTPRQEDSLVRRRTFLTASAAALYGLTRPLAAQGIETALTLITPVSKFIHDAALTEFSRYAQERWKVNVTTTALPAGTPVAYDRIVGWKGVPEVDLFWGGESALFDKLAMQKLLAPLNLPKAASDSIPATIGRPKPIYLKDPKGYWIGTALEPYGLVYNPALLKRLGVAPPKDWDDLLNPKLRGHIAQCAPHRSSSSHATYEVILLRYGEPKGWEWLKRLAANTGVFTARSRDVPAVVAKGDFAVGFAVPSYMAFEERLAGFDIRFVAPATAWITPEPIGVLAGAKHPLAARAFVEFLLTERGQKIFMARGLFPLSPKYQVKGAPGSDAEKAVVFTGGVRSYFGREVTNIYEYDKAQARYQQVNDRFHKEIEAAWDELKKKY
jgi:ABC-type Fe3+ transport system substrate-binding protein